MHPTQIGRSVCQCICRSGCKCWNEMDVQLFFEGTATHLIIETPPIEFQHLHLGSPKKLIASSC